MTNTPMTSREAFALYCVEQKSKGYWVVIEDDFIAGYEASKAQQAQVIAELKRQISAKDSLIDSYREMEADCTKQAQTISELVECLEEILIDTNEGQIMHIASEALAIVKGK